MTVHVLQQVVRKIACQHCGSLLGYIPSDIRKTVHYDYKDTAEPVQYIECPECTKHVKISRI